MTTFCQCFAGHANRFSNSVASLYSRAGLSERPLSFDGVSSRAQPYDNFCDDLARDGFRTRAIENGPR